MCESVKGEDAEPALPALSFSPFYHFLLFLYSVRRMLRGLLGFLWRKAPKRVRLLGVRLTEPRFNVTAGAVVFNEQGEVLLLKHVFRAGSGWGIPGGFLEKGEQPDEAIRRELLEEAGLELESAELAFVRTLKTPARVEIIFRCRPRGRAVAQGFEIKSAEWFAPDNLPPGLSHDQKRLIKRALGDGAKHTD